MIRKIEEEYTYLKKLVAMRVGNIDERTKACRIIDQWYLAMREFLYAIR